MEEKAQSRSDSGCHMSFNCSSISWDVDVIEINDINRITICCSSTAFFRTWLSDKGFAFFFWLEKYLFLISILINLQDHLHFAWVVDGGWILNLFIIIEYAIEPYENLQYQPILPAAI